MKGLTVRVDGCLKIADYGIDFVLARLRRSGGGHEPAAEFADSFLPDLRFCAGVVQVEQVHGEASRPVFGIMAFHAVGLDEAVKRLAAASICCFLAMGYRTRQPKP